MKFTEVTFGIGGAAGIMRLQRTTMLEVLRSDYVRTARAKGLSGGGVIIRHAFRNTLTPLVTTIGTSFTLVFAGSVVGRLARLPGVTMTITDMNSDEQVRSLTVDRIDLGFIHARPDIRGLARCNVVVDAFAVALPATHALASRSGLHLRDLQDEAMVAFSREHAPALFEALIASCQQEGFSPRIAHVARHPASVLQMVQLGLGVSIVPRAYSTYAPPAVVFRQLSSMAARLRIDALWREGNPAPGLRRVIADVLQTFAHDGAANPG